MPTKNLPVVQLEHHQLYNTSCPSCTTGKIFVGTKKGKGSKPERKRLQGEKETSLILQNFL